MQTQSEKQSLQPADMLRSSLRLADEGQLARSAQQLRHLPAHHSLADLFESTATMLKTGIDKDRRLRTCLDRLCASQQAIRIYTTLDGPAPLDWSARRDDWQARGNGDTQFSHCGVNLVTLGDQDVSLALRQSLPTASTLVVHVLAYFPSNVSDNFYMTLGGCGEEESFRFSNYGVTLCRDACLHVCNTKVEKLYSVIIGDGYVSLFVNGVLSIRKRRENAVPPKQLAFQLVGETSADLNGIVLGCEVWTLAKPSRSCFPQSLELFHQMFQDTLQRHDAQCLYETLMAIDGINLVPHAQECLDILDQLLERRQHKDWIFETLLAELDATVVQQWKADNLKRFPEPVVAVRDLTVQFSKSPHRVLSLGRILRRGDRQLFDVLKDVSFRLYNGDILGIIGANGAGKSTLLKTLAALVPIKTGEVNVLGQHLLLSAGLGMRMEMSGRENIYLAGCFMGLRPQEIDRLCDGIIEFAELQDAIDRPFKYYSDGMKARLVFSIATSVSPDILMLDELLNAGDIKFQEKAARRMDELIRRARLVIVVTHGMYFVRQHCTKALYLNSGRQVYFGDVETAITRYLNDLHMGRSVGMDDMTAQHMTTLQQL